MAELPDITLLKHGILSKNPQVKNNGYKALLSIAREHPEFLYPDWDFFASLIEAERGADTKYIGIYILAELTSVDIENKFQRVFDKFYALLDDNSIIPASHAALTSGRISRHLPYLTGKITERLLAIDETHHPTPRRELIKSYVIQAIEEYFESLDRKQMQEVMEFVSRQRKSSSPKTAKIACQFLKTHPVV